MSNLEDNQSTKLEHTSFVMYLKPGCEQLYKEQHDNIWPTLITLLKSYGISNYHIVLHTQSHQLFASFHYDHRYDPIALATEPLMLKWWKAMSELMLTNNDAYNAITRTGTILVRDPNAKNLAPLTTHLTPVFYLP